MKGFVATPAHVVDLMVEKLFRLGPPGPEARLLDPGCGTGEFIDGVLRWCGRHAVPAPTITGIELDPRHVTTASVRFAGIPQVQIVGSDFLVESSGQYDYIIGNPPYVPITRLSVEERRDYRESYATAKGRFDLYLLFFERALRLLRKEGRLVFITPEKFLYVDTAAPLRRLLSSCYVEELHFLPEDTFSGLVTYPLVSTIVQARRAGPTTVRDRRGSERFVRGLEQSASWMPRIQGARSQPDAAVLSDICRRISCGVATGADSVFVLPRARLPVELGRFAHPTIAGRQLGPGKELIPSHCMLVPYERDGTLLAESRLGQLAAYLSEPTRRAKLLGRTCVARKPWYAFHETPPLPDLLRPKILCKDIGVEPFFAVDRDGTIVPRHSVYYIVPAHAEALGELAVYLNSPVAKRWLSKHSQRASNGFLRLQSHVLKRLPVPSRLADPQLRFAAAS